MANKKPNDLINETSPYLLQHANNPVNWVPWSKEAFVKAEAEDKLVIISVGYSACHWCHVMEKESFEDEKVAALMNEFYVCIKVDREERPDVDNLYMTAVQLMTGHGGWPLNCVTLPNGQPIYGGTYFNKAQWTNVLTSIADLNKNDKTKINEYAKSLTEGILQSELISTKQTEETLILATAIEKAVGKWKTRFDNEHGGPNKVPKFPMPNNYSFLLRYAFLYGDKAVLSHVNLTLEKMAHGGLYDQVHGGFARYSTDGIWKLPHFEKMLYDNAQLVSLYCEAYKVSHNELYKQIVLETLEFVKTDWLKPEGCFYSAYDADSEGVEGKFYVWSENELKGILEADFEVFQDFYQINEIGYWEDENYILMRNSSIAPLLAKHEISIVQLNAIIKKCKLLLKKVANSRVKPGLDDKTITSWNALMIKAYVDAYLTFGIQEHKTIAVKAAEFLLQQQKKSNDELYRIYKNGVSKIEAFLDDYAFTIDALISVNTIDRKAIYLESALALTEVVRLNFSKPNTPLFFYTNSKYSELLTQQTETSDNVIPSSNSQMALNLFYLGKVFDKENYVKQAEEMLQMFTSEMANYGAGYSNWGCLALHLAKPFNEVVIVGKHVDEILKELQNHYLTNTILAVSESNSQLPLFKNRWKEGETLIYVCKNNACKLPVKTVKEALKIIEEA